MTGRRLITRKGALLLGALLLVCAAALWAVSRRPAGRVAVIERDGAEVERISLSALAGPEERTVRGENGLELTVMLTPDGAWVENSQCPDKICVHTGKLTRAGEAAVCLPARVVLRLEGKGGADAITGE